MTTLRIGLMLPVLFLCLEESFTSPVALPQDRPGNPQLQGNLSMDKEYRYNRGYPANSPRWQFWKWLGWKHRDEDKDLEVDSAHQKVATVDPGSDNLNTTEEKLHVLEPVNSKAAIPEEEIIQSTIRFSDDTYSRQETHTHATDTGKKDFGDEIVVYEPNNISDNETRQELDKKTNGKAEENVAHYFEHVIDDFGPTTNSDDEEKVTFILDEDHGDSSEVEQVSTEDYEDENNDDPKLINDDIHDPHIIVQLDDGTLISDEDLNYLESFYNEYLSASLEEQGNSEVSTSWPEYHSASSEEQEISEVSKSWSKYHSASTEEQDSSDVSESWPEYHSASSEEQDSSEVSKSWSEYHSASSEEQESSEVSKSWPEYHSASSEEQESSDVSESWPEYHSASSEEQESSEVSQSWSEYHSASSEEQESSEVSQSWSESDESDWPETVLPEERTKLTGSDRPKPDKSISFDPITETGHRRTGCRLKNNKFDLFDVSEIDDFAQDASDNNDDNTSKVRGIIIWFWKFVFKTILRCLGL